MLWNPITVKCPTCGLEHTRNGGKLGYVEPEKHTCDTCRNQAIDNQINLSILEASKAAVRYAEDHGKLASDVFIQAQLYVLQDMLLERDETLKYWRAVRDGINYGC